MEIIGWQLQKRTIWVITNGGGKQYSKASRTQCLWITCFLGAKWPKKTTNSPGDWQILINVRQILVMRFTGSSFYWAGSQRSKLCYLIESFVPKQCSNSSSRSYFMICVTEMAEIMDEVSLWNYRNDQKMPVLFHSLEKVKSSIGQREKMGKKEEWLWGWFTFTCSPCCLTLHVHILEPAVTVIKMHQKSDKPPLPLVII